MKNKTDSVPYPYYSLRMYFQYQLEILRNTYQRKKEEAFFNQCRYAKKKSQQNRYKMNCSFLECSEYKHKIRQVEKWIKDLGKERDLQKENERLKAQNEKMQCCENCKHKQCGMKEIYKEVKQKDKTKTCDEWELAE